MDATQRHGCLFFDDLLGDIKDMKPLASLYDVKESNDDFGCVDFEPFGDFPSYEHSGLSLSMINVPSWMKVEEILSSQVNVNVPL